MAMSVSAFFRRHSRLAWPRIALYVALSVMLAGLHAVEINFGPRQEQRQVRHEKVLDGRGQAPWVHRVLTPAVAEIVAQPLKPALGVRLGRESAYILIHGVAMFATFLLFHAFIRTWLDSAWATGGTLFFSALHPATYRYYWFQPDSPTDLLIWVTAGWLTVNQRDKWLFPLIVIGALNRETSLFIVVMFLALRWGSQARRTLFVRAGTMLLAWLFTSVLLRVAIGMKPWAADILDLVSANMQPAWLAYALAFLAPMLIIAFSGWSRRPLELRRLAIALFVTYLPLQLVFGRIREVRLLLPLAIALIPLGMLTLRDSVAQSDASE